MTIGSPAPSRTSWRTALRNNGRKRLTYTTLALCLSTFSLSIFSLSAYAATYYRWVDDEGTTHYTSTPPQGRASEKVTSGVKSRDKTPTAEPEQPAHKSAEPAEKESNPPQTVAVKDPERCKAAQERVRTLESNRRIRMATEDGGFRYLTEEDIQEELEKSQQVIKHSC